MEKIKILIEQLGAIRNSEIEVSQMMLFSGESGLGKSYLAMLCHYIYDVLLSDSRFDRFIKEEKKWSFSSMRESFKDSGIAVQINKKELEDWLSNDAIQYLRYMLNNENLKCKISIKLPDIIQPIININFEEEFLGLENSEDVYIKLNALNLTYRVKEEAFDDESPFAFLLRFGLIRQILGDFRALNETYVFPPSRGPVLTETIAPKTGLYEKFKKGMALINRVPPHPENVSVNLISLLREVLDGSVKNEEGKYIYSTHEEDIPISAAAASVREIAPIALLVERVDMAKTCILLEEPEAHLHPIKQRMMADIVSLMNTGGAYMQLTTHSDYFLRRINELIALRKIHECLAHEEKGESKFNEICKELNLNKDLEFDYKRLSAYLLRRNSDGSSVVEKQNIVDGVPFASFSQAIDESLRLSYKLNEYLEKNDCN